MTHDELMNSLADHLAGENRMVWRDMQLGPAGNPRPDVYAIFRSFAHPCPMAYECKASRADFLADVTAGKWMSYLEYASSVVFACEEGLLKKSEVPNHCGLITYKPGLIASEGRWRTTKRPVHNPVVVPQEALLKLLIDGVAREGPRYRAKFWSESATIDRIEKKFGNLVAQTIRNQRQVEYEVEQAKNHANRIVEDARDRAERIKMDASMATVEPARRDLCESLGLSVTSSHFEIRQAVSRITSAAKENPQVKKYRQFTQDVERSIQWYGYKEDGKETEQETP